MRSVIPAIIAVAVAGCTAAPPPMAGPTPQAQARLTEILAGKVAGPPQSCLSNWRAREMVVIDPNTILFQEPAGSRVWVQKPRSPCDRLGTFSYALVTRSTINQLCSGDIGQIVDTSAGITIGSCVMGEFIPYAPAAS